MLELKEEESNIYPGSRLTYPKELREEVRKRIKELKMEQYKNVEIADIMNTEDFKTPAGGSLSEMFVTRQLHAISNKAKKRQKKAREMASPVKVVYNAKTAPSTDRGCPLYIQQILTNDDMDASTKVHILRGYYQV